MSNNFEKRSFFEKLLRPLEEEGHLACSAYLFDVEKVRVLAVIFSHNQARKMFNEGSNWAVSSWTTSRVSSVPWNLVGVLWWQQRRQPIGTPGCWPWPWFTMLK